MMNALGPKTYLPPLKKSNVAYGLWRSKEMYTRMKALQSFLAYVGSFRASGAAATLINLQLDYFLDRTADDARMEKLPEDPALVTLFSDNARGPVLGDTSKLDEVIENPSAKSQTQSQGRQCAFMDDGADAFDSISTRNVSLDWDCLLDPPMTAGPTP